MSKSLQLAKIYLNNLDNNISDDSTLLEATQSFYYTLQALAEAYYEFGSGEIGLHNNISLSEKIIFMENKGLDIPDTLIQDMPRINLWTKDFLKEDINVTTDKEILNRNIPYLHKLYSAMCSCQKDVQ